MTTGLGRGCGREERRGESGESRLPGGSGGGGGGGGGRARKALPSLRLGISLPSGWPERTRPMRLRRVQSTLGRGIDAPSCPTERDEHRVLAEGETSGE